MTVLNDLNSALHCLFTKTETWIKEEEEENKWGEDLRNRFRKLQYVSQSFMLYIYFWLETSYLDLSLLQSRNVGSYLGTLEMDTVIFLHYFLEQTWPLSFPPALPAGRLWPSMGFILPAKWELFFTPSLTWQDVIVRHMVWEHWHVSYD